MKHFLLFLFIGLLTACEYDNLPLEDHSDGYGPQVIQVAPVTEPDEQDILTRGKPITSVSEMTDISVFCSYTGPSDWSTGSASGKMFDNRLLRNTTTGRWEYANGPVNWNATSNADRYSFFAYAPYATAQNGIVVQGNSSTTGIPSLIYTTPTNTASQPDLMFASPRYNLRASTSMVSLQMKHALTCVGFQIQGNGEQIKSLTLSGINSRGQAKIDGNTIVWTPIDQPSTFSPLLNYDEGKSYYTATATMSSNLLPGNGYLMMIPQTLTSSALLTVTFSDNSTRSLNISGNWIAGKKITYNIILTEQGILTITPSTLLLPQLGVSALTDNLSLSCAPASATWTITTNSSWLRITTDPSGAGAQQTISGRGSVTLYTVADPNPLSTDRTTTITVQGQTPVITLVTVTQLRQILPATIGTGTPPTGVSTYVGAFWRSYQVGERIIRIPIGSDAGNVGNWSASIIWQDGNWALGDILFSTAESLDPNVSFSLISATPGNAEGYKVTEAKTVASGNVTTNGILYFRVGLRNQFTPSITTPARYAVIALSYNNRSKTQLLFLRQGEGPDYLMRPTDAAIGSYVNATRPLAQKISCYNLTSPYPNWGGGVLIADHPTLSYQGAALTEYPTQAGAMFQWSSIDLPRRAIHPITPELLPIVGWSNNYDTRYWVDGSPTLALTQDVCPEGYRRINDGVENAASDLKASKSELRQSLFATLQDGSSTSNENTVVGYYADGFFDRRYLASSSSSIIGSVVSYFNGITDIRNANVAYKGTLLFNPNNWASLFFPSAGLRPGQTSGVPIRDAGKCGYYWTSSSYSNNTYGLITSFGEPGYLKTNGYQALRHTAMSVRCIRIP